MPIGTVRFFKSDQGVGSIHPDSGGDELYIHISSIDPAEAPLAEGQKVRYEIGTNPFGRAPVPDCSSAHLADAELSDREILAVIADEALSARERVPFVCEAELIRFEDEDRTELVRVLWKYIQENRDGNDPAVLIAVGSAIRKYVANMPMERMGTLSELLEPGHRSPLDVTLELELAKMVFRFFKVYPPTQRDPEPELGTHLWKMAQDYINPRFLLREDHAAVASLAIGAVIAMRSEYAEQAWRLAAESPYRWFFEVVEDDLDALREEWVERNAEAADWLDRLRGASPATKAL